MSGGHNAMLESPTGTGKTISLLCAASAFIKNWHEKRNSAPIANKKGQWFNNINSQSQPPTLIYCARTHS